jgi:hypothetical protein
VNVVRLRDFDKYPRPGEGVDPDESWRKFRHSAEALAINWPDEVLRQFVFDHGRLTEFEEQYGHLDLSKLCWQLRDVFVSQLVQASTHPELGGRSSDVAKDLSYYRTLYKESGVNLPDSTAWLVPPVFVERSLISDNDDGQLHLVEGHTRLGFLRAMSASGSVSPDGYHLAWVGTPCAT